MIRSRTVAAACAAFAVLLAPHPLAAAQDDGPDAGTPEPGAPPTTAPEPGSDAPPSLDDLLGIETDENEASGADLAGKEAEAELSRRLREEPLGDAFAIAIEKMTISADQLDRRFDTGLGTQRVQEEILARLDHLIDQAKKKQNKGGSSGQSSSSQSEQQQQQQKKQQQPGRRPDQPQPGGERQKDASDSQEGDPPAPQAADANIVLDESRSEWGTLPQRVRDMLLQGRTEKYSSLYEQLTREYYKRLAEEGS